MPDFAATIERIMQKAAADGWDELTPLERTVVCVVDLDTDVGMGGLDGYYQHGSGDRALDAVAALERIGASQSAAILRRANSLFPGGAPSAEQDEREEAIDQMPDAEDVFRALTDEYMSRPDDLGQRLEEFVLARRQELS